MIWGQLWKIWTKVFNPTPISIVKQTSAYWDFTWLVIRLNLLLSNFKSKWISNPSNSIFKTNMAQRFSLYTWRGERHWSASKLRNYLYAVLFKFLKNGSKSAEHLWTLIRNIIKNANAKVHLETCLLRQNK